MGRSQSCPEVDPIRNQAAGIWISESSTARAEVSTRAGWTVIAVAAFSLQGKCSSARFYRTGEKTTRVIVSRLWQCRCPGRGGSQRCRRLRQRSRTERWLKLSLPRPGLGFSPRNFPEEVSGLQGVRLFFRRPEQRQRTLRRWRRRALLLWVSDRRLRSRDLVVSSRGQELALSLPKGRPRHIAILFVLLAGRRRRSGGGHRALRQLKRHRCGS